MNRFSVHLKDKQQQAIDDIVRESKVDTDVPDLSQSEVVRRLVDVGLEESDDLRSLVDDASLVLLRRERFKDREAKLTNLRSGFEPRVKGHFTKRFENGIAPEQLLEFAQNMREDARLLWPEELAPDDPEEAEQYHARRREVIDWIDATVEAYIDAYQESDHDPLDPDEIFSHYGGVECGREKQQAQAKGVDLTRRARELAEVAEHPDPDAIATALARQEGVGRQAALEAAQTAVSSQGGAPADD